MVMFVMAECRILVVWAFVVLYIADISSAVAVSSTTCTSGGTECSTITNSACDTSLKCKCNQGYKENTNTCAAIAGLTAACNLSSDCASVTNAECVTSTCQCSNGYKTNSATCVLVYGTHFTGTAICWGLANSACTGGKCAWAAGYFKNSNICSPISLGDNCSAVGDCKAVANSKCATTCACADGYTKIKNACVKGLADSCSADTDCSAVENAECDTNCKCSNGYKAHDATCDKVYGTGCTGTGICDGLANSACAESKCSCASSYVESNYVCALAVSNTKCTDHGNECPVNAMCENTKCKCDVGFTEHADKCVAESGAASTKATSCIVFGLMWLLWKIMSIM